MANSPISKSATTSNAAKDDAVGQDGDFTFTINDLLKNDPGSAAKADLSKQFFFGDAAHADGSIPTIAEQVQYLSDHGITANVVDGKFVSFEIGVGATDINYFVQMGNKGTWSEAHVDVTAPVPHAGNLLLSESFEHYTNSDSFEAADMSGGGWTNVNGTGTEIVHSGLCDTTASDGVYWLDTQASPGGIDITHSFTDTTGGQAQLTFDIAVQDFMTGGGQHLSTADDPNAAFEFRVDDQTVATVTVDDILALTNGQTGEMASFDVKFDVTAAGPHTLELVDVSHASNVGFAVDNVQIHDWIV